MTLPANAWNRKAPTLGKLPDRRDFLASDFVCESTSESCIRAACVGGRGPSHFARKSCARLRIGEPLGVRTTRRSTSNLSGQATIQCTKLSSKPRMAATRLKALSKLRKSIRPSPVGTAALKMRFASQAVKQVSNKQQCLHKSMKPRTSISGRPQQKVMKTSDILDLACRESVALQSPAFWSCG